MGFYTRLVQGLLDSGFRAVKNLYDSEAVTENSKYIGLLKRSGDVIYAAAVYNADKDPYYISVYNQMSGFFKQSFAVSQSSKIILLNIFVSQNPTDELKSFCTVDVDSFDADFTDLRWIADTGSGKRLVLGHQPDKVLDIGKIADKSFGGVGGEATLRDMTAKANSMDKSRIKSGNYVLTIVLLALNGIVFAAMELYGGSQNTNVLLDFGALQKNLVFGGQWYRLFTYMFLHIGIMHLLANCFSLYILGMRTEKYYGKVGFLIIYILSGLAAGLASVLFTDSVSAGASGALFGLDGAIIAYTLVTGKSMDGFDLYVILIFSIVGIGCGMLMPNVDNIAHVGGCIAGFIVSVLILLAERKRTGE